MFFFFRFDVLFRLQRFQSPFQVRFPINHRFCFRNPSMTHFGCCCSYLDSPDLIKKTKTTIKLKNEDNKCFQYVVTVALNFREIESYPERVSNIKL